MRDPEIRKNMVGVVLLLTPIITTVFITSDYETHVIIRAAVTTYFSLKLVLSIKLLSFWFDGTKANGIENAIISVYKTYGADSVLGMAEDTITDRKYYLQSVLVVVLAFASNYIAVVVLELLYRVIYVVAKYQIGVYLEVMGEGKNLEEWFQEE